MHIKGGKSPVLLISSRYDIDIARINIMVSKWLENNHQQSSLDLYNLVAAGEIIIKAGELHSLQPLSLEESQSLVSDIKTKYNLDIRDRWHNFKCYRQCFIGSELVDCLVENKNISQEEAIALGQELFKHCLIRHVCNDHDFKNDFLFYRFHS